MREAIEMYNPRSPAEAYRKVDFDARIAGADAGQLVLVCYEQLGSALGSAIHAAAAGDNARKSAGLTRALAALTALQLGLDHQHPIAASLATLFEAAALEWLKGDVIEIAAALRA
jgi:flagellin-specific chaperone FliS